jgi:hypothetical protein
MGGHEGMALSDRHRAWQEAGDELVPDYVDVEYTEREFEEIRARIAHAMMSVGMVEEERERMLEGLEEVLAEG